MNSKYKVLAKNTVIFTISSFGSKLLSFFLVPLYTNILSKAEYGTVDIISTSVSLLLFILTLNISSAVLRFAIEDVEAREQIFKIGLKFNFLGTLILLVFIIIAFMLKLFAWENYCYVCLVLYFSLMGLNELFNNYLKAIDKTINVAISGIVVTTVTIVCNIVFLILFKWGLFGYLAATILGQFSAVLYGFVVIHPWRYTKDRLYKNNLLIKEMITYSIPLSFNGIAWWINASLDKYFILLRWGIDQNGLYAVASKIPTILNMCFSIFLQAWGLSAIREFDEEDKDGFFAETFLTVNAFVVIACSGLILFNIPLARILFANDFFEAWKCSSVLVLSGVFSGMGGFIGSIFSAVKDSKSFALSTVMGAGINCILNIILIPSMGILGAAIATAVSFAAVYFVRCLLMRKYIKWKVNFVYVIIEYMIIVFQIVVEHTPSHMYFVQVALFIILLVLHKKQIFVFFDKLKGILLKKK